MLARDTFSGTLEFPPEVLLPFLSYLHNYPKLVIRFINNLIKGLFLVSTCDELSLGTNLITSSQYNKFLVLKQITE